MTATNNLPTSTLIDSLVGNYQGNTRRIMIDKLAALLGDGGSGSGSSLAAEIADRIAADDAIRASKADLQNSGKFFTSRDAAVSAGQDNLPGSLSMIVTVEGDWVVFRSFNNTSDDPLFPTQPSWGVSRRAPNQPVITAIQASKADLQNSGKFFTSRDAAVSAGQDNLPGSLSMIVTVEGDWVVFRSFNNTSDDPLFPTQPSWGVSRRAPNQPVITAIQASKADLQNSGKFFTSRDAAVSAGQDNLPGSLSMIVTVEGDWVVFRSFNNTSDDPLFPTQPSWGVSRRAPNQPVITAIQSDLDNGRVFYASGATSPSGRDIPQSADLVIANHNASNSYSIWRSVAPPPDGLETETMAKDSNNRWWVFSIDRSVSDEASVKAAAIRDSVVMPLANIGGTGDAITADLAATMTAAGITSLSSNSEVEYIPVTTNAAENPTITIAGTSYDVRNANGITWPAGGFVVNRSYMLRRRDTVMRVISGDATSIELSSARAERVSAEAQIGSPTLATVAGTGNAVTASVPASLQSAGITAANLRAVNLVWPADNAAGAVTLNIDGAGAVEVRTAGNAVPSASMLRGGRMVALVKSGTVWRLASSELTLSDLQTEITSRTAADDLRTAAIRDSVVMPLANIGGTGDAITAAGITSLSSNSEVEYIPAATNAAENPTITIAGTSYGIRDANGSTWPAAGFVVGRSYKLRRRNTLMRVTTGEVTSSELQAEAAARMADTGTSMAMLSEISAGVAADYESIAKDGVDWFGWDTQGNAILGWSPTGLMVHLDDWTISNAGPRIMAAPGLEAEQSSGETIDGRVLQTDATGNVVWMWRNGDNGGLDAIMSQAFWDRGRNALNLTAQDVSATAWQAISVNGQSLSVGGDWAGSPVTRAEFMSRVDPSFALMLTGTVRGDNVPITTVDMPRSQGYNAAVPATGVAPADTSTQVVSAAAPLAYIVNAYRDDLGLPMVPVITQCHGISGIPIEDIDDDPATGSGQTIVWDNLRFWYQQVVAQATAQGKALTVPWHDWVHGTSAQSYDPGVYEAALWSYQSDFRAFLKSIGADGQAMFVMSQPGGNANTSGSTAYWHVCDEILNFCESGGGVLATPEYAYQIADNNVHPNAYWTIQFQEVKGRAIAEIEAGRPWTIHRPKAKVAGTTVILDFDSLRPGEYLVLHDPARYGGQGIDAYAGFEAVGASITGMEIRGRQVILVCSAAPTGIRYAMQKQNVSGFAGNLWTAHRGLLRTSDVWPSKLLPGVDLYRWVPSFTMPL